MVQEQSIHLLLSMTGKLCGKQWQTTITKRLQASFYLTICLTVLPTSFPQWHTRTFKSLLKCTFKAKWPSTMACFLMSSSLGLSVPRNCSYLLLSASWFWEDRQVDRQTDRQTDATSFPNFMPFFDVEKLKWFCSLLVIVSSSASCPTPSISTSNPSLVLGPLQVFCDLVFLTIDSS